MQTNRADAGQGPPVTWFGWFEEVELGDRHGRVVLDDAIPAKQVLGPVDAFGDQPKGVNRKGDVPLISMRLCLPGQAEEDADQASRHTDHHATSLPRIPSEQNRGDDLRTRAIQLIH